MHRRTSAAALKRLARKVLPEPLWRWLGREIKDLPFRLRDLGPDLRERLCRPAGQALPPPSLRRRVGLTSARSEFLGVGQALSESVLAAFEARRRPEQSYRRWLDFGCGSGRVARFLAGPERELWGVDVDRAAIRWARRSLGERFVATVERPPLPFAEEAFDVVCALSVFTHLDAEMEIIWLEELRRILRRGGLLVASTHHEDLQSTRPDLTLAERSTLAAKGFLFAPGRGLFNDNSTFHTLPYLERTWGRLFTLGSYTRRGLAGYQDLSVWEAR